MALSEFAKIFTEGNDLDLRVRMRGLDENGSEVFSEMFNPITQENSLIYQKRDVRWTYIFMFINPSTNL